MTNDNYSVARRNIPKLSEITDVSEEECYMFYDYTQSSLKSKVETALNRLRSKCLIIYNKTYTVVKRDGERNALGEVKLRKDGSFKLKEIHREATEAELALVLNYEKEVIDKLGVEDLQHIFLTGQWKSFKRIVNDMLKEQANIEYYYESYKILFNVDNIKDYLLQQDDLMEVESTLNSNIKEMINTNSNKSHDKATAWVAFGDTSDKKINIKASNKYVDNVDVLTETVIDKEAKDIREDLQKFAVKKQYEYVKTSNSDMPF